MRPADRAAIAGPAGAVVGGLIGSQVAADNSQGPKMETAPQPANDAITHANLKRILVPVDFSGSSQGALHFTKQWAEHFGSEVCLLHVIEKTDAGAPPDPEKPVMSSSEKVRAELEKLAAREFSDASKVSVHFRTGIPYVEIATAARELAADLIIVGPHGHTGSSRALMDSTAERLVRHSPCSVLMLRRAW